MKINELPHWTTTTTKKDTSSNLLSHYFLEVESFPSWQIFTSSKHSTYSLWKSLNFPAGSWQSSLIYQYMRININTTFSCRTQYNLTLISIFQNVRPSSPFWATIHFVAYDFIVAPNKNGLLATPNTTTALNYLYGSKNYLHIYFP